MSPQTGKRPMTAAESYASRLEDCREHLESLSRMLEQHSAQQAGSPRRAWSRVGDLGQVEGFLREAREFMATAP